MNGLAFGHCNTADAVGSGESALELRRIALRQRDEEAAGSLRIVEQVVEFGRSLDAARNEFAIVIQTTGDGALSRVVERAGQEADGAGIDFDGDFTGDSHL